METFCLLMDNTPVRCRGRCYTRNNPPRPLAVIVGRPLRRGRSPQEAPAGGVSLRKAPLGPIRLIELQLALPLLYLFLLPDVLSHLRLGQPHRTHTVPAAQKCN